MSATARVEIPPKLIPVFSDDVRFRCAYGGRGSAKTRTFAKMAAIRAFVMAEAGEEGVILSARELMNSLDDSSMAEIKTAIRSEPWLEANFEIGERFIRTRNRRVEFRFAGLRHNTDSIKSKSRILICWIDEAENVSQAAWDKLLPTVREGGSEVWVTWNPERDGSATDVMFRKEPPESARIVEINWGDNPWFPDVLRQQMEWDRRRDPEKYQHIWEGKYLSRSNAQVFKNWTVDAFEAPEDARFYFGGDWGYAVDPSVLIRCWIDGRKLFIDAEAYRVGCPIDHTPALFAGDCPYDRADPRWWPNPDGLPGITGAHDWPITADSSRPETIRHMRDRGFDIAGARKGAGSVADGIEHLKSFDIVVHRRCKRTVDELTAYRWKVDDMTGDVLPVLADKDNHVIDALRYALESLRVAARREKRKGLTVGGERLANWAAAV